MDNVADMNALSDVGETYSMLASLLRLYSTLSDEDRLEVAVEYDVLMAAVKDYNEKAQKVNDEVSEAANVAFTPLVKMGLTVLVAGSFLSKKRFWI